MESKNSAMEVVLSYIKALGRQDYDAAGNYLNESVRVVGPAGEAFRNPREFIDMLRQYRGKYDLKKTFVDGDDVCLFYDFVTPVATVFMSSWYQVKNEKIASVRTVFDPRPFSPRPDKKNT